MAQTVDVGSLIARLVMLAGGYAVHQIVRRALWPGLWHGGVGQVGSDGRDPLGQLPGRATQATDLPAFSQQLAGQTAAYITTSHDNCGKV